MKKSNKTNLQRVEAVLLNYDIHPGVSARGISIRTKLPLSSVYAAIRGLKVKRNLSTTYHVVDGKTRAFYRLT